MPSLAQWHATWDSLGVGASPRIDAAFTELIARHSEPHRRYHTCRHLDECFERLAEVRSLAEHPAEVELALWFHDAIYEPRSPDSEARSAELASRTMRESGASTGSMQNVAALILATRHAEVPTAADAVVLVDVDLSILGANPARFDEYERQVREEYAWVPAPAFERERRKVLAGFLARPHVFNTVTFRQRYEARARDNLARSLARLHG